MQSILSRYSHLPGNRDLVFKSLCALLAENPNQIDWTEFGQQEWGLLGKLAVDEGVAAMAYYLLREQPDADQRSAMDPQTLQILAKQEAVTAVRNAVLFRQLGRLLRVLSEINVPVVLLKGADLARSLYPEPGLRPMGDLDLWVPEKHFEEALRSVKSLGYRADIPEASPGFDRLLSHHVHLRYEGLAATQLELHWTLVAPPAYRHAVPMDWFEENLEPARDWNENPVSAVQNSVFTLNPTANLLYLTAHQTLQHSGAESSLRWLLDLHRLVGQRGEEIDWQVLRTQAGLFGWCGAFGAGLEAVQACFATCLPDGLLADLQAEAGGHEARLKRLSEPSPTRTLTAWNEFSSMSWAGRWRLLRTRAFPTRAYLRWRYPPRPDWFWPLSYVHFWTDVAQDGWRTLRHILHRPSKNT